MLYRDDLSRLSEQVTQRFRALLATLIAIYREPFQAYQGDALAHSFEIIEQRRRIALFRLVAFTFTIFLIILAPIQLILQQIVPFVRLANLLEILLGIICLILSYGRWAHLASYFYAFGSLFRLLIFAQSDPDGLTERAALVYSLITLIIIGIGLIVPRQTFWPTNIIIIAMSLVSVSLLPVKHATSPTLPYPHVLTVVYLFGLYIFVAILTWVFVSSAHTGMEALAQAFTLEQEVQRLKDEYFNIASHELRAPLTPILLGSRLIQRRLSQEGQDAQLSRLADDMTQRAKHMSNMVDLLLDVTRVQREQLPLDRESHDVARIIREVVEAQEAEWKRPIETDGLAQPIMGEVDTRRLWQVMTNLLTNAMKYTPDDAQITVQVKRLIETKGNILWVEVRDQGQGISAHDLPHLFERFYRASRGNSGLGLGLYICKAIIEAHGGTITAESVEGKGTAFTITMPLFSA